MLALDLKKSKDDCVSSINANVTCITLVAWINNLNLKKMEIDEIVNSKVKTMTDLNGKKSKVLLLKNEAEIEAFKKQLALCNVSSSLTAKEVIDYQIKAKRKDKEENLNEWVKSIAFVCVFWVVIIIILKSCSS